MTNNHKTQEVAKKRSKVVELKFDVYENIFLSAVTKSNCKPSFLHKNKKTIFHFSVHEETERKLAPLYHA